MSAEDYSAYLAARRSAYLHASKWFRVWHRVLVVFVIEWVLSIIATLTLTGLPRSFAVGVMVGSTLSVLFVDYKRFKHEMKMHQMDDGGL